MLTFTALAYRGGCTDPCIVNWTKGIKVQGELRSQYAHAIDLLPTILEALELDIEANDWELYHVAEDYSECHNLAAENRDKVIDMVGRWWTNP